MTQAPLRELETAPAFTRDFTAMAVMPLHAIAKSPAPEPPVDTARGRHHAGKCMLSIKFSQSMM